VIQAEFSSHLSIAESVIPLLMKQCNDIIEQFIIDDRNSGSMPLPRYRLMVYLDFVGFFFNFCVFQEVNFVLENLKNFNLQQPIDQLNGSTESDTLRSLKKPHLFKLFPLLAELVTIKENSIKKLLCEVLQVIASDLESHLGIKMHWAKRSTEED